MPACLIINEAIQGSLYELSGPIQIQVTVTIASAVPSAVSD